MATVTVLYWYGFQEVGDRKVEGVYAECPLCGHRVFAKGLDTGARDRALRRLSAQCPRDENNTYTIPVLPPIDEGD